MHPALRRSLAGLLVASLSLPASALPRERDRWLRVETAHFVFFSAAKEENTRRIANNLERLHSVLEQINPGVELGSDRPIYLYVFEDDRSLKPYKPLYNGKPANVSGYFFARPEASYMVMQGEADQEVERILYHEYMHYALGRIYATVPAWFNEGMAELYSTFQPSTRHVEIGHPIGVHIETLRDKKLISLARLFAIDSSSAEYNERSRQGIFYAESWALIHYLLLGNRARREQTFQFFKEMTEGKPGVEAFHGAFPEGEAQIEKELREYIRGNRFTFALVPVKPAETLEIRMEPLAREETLTRLGELLLNQGDRALLPEAGKHFQAALAARPGYEPALAALRRMEPAASHN